MKHAEIVLLSTLLLACNQSKARKASVYPPLDPASVVAFASDTFSEGFDGGVQGPNGSNWWVNETPAHNVTLSAFSIDRSEVTVARYATFLETAGGLGHWAPSMPIRVGQTTQDFTPAPGKTSVAMYNVTWFDARAFCLWMGGDLPTEAQWEYAAKHAAEHADGGAIYPWGAASPTCARANYFNGNVACASGPGDAGALPAGDTPNGIHDMAGNVAEWTYDAYGPYPSGSRKNPSGQPAPVHGADAGAVLRVIRGGGYHDIGLSLRTTNRYGADAALRSRGVGFRCAYP